MNNHKDDEEEITDAIQNGWKKRGQEMHSRSANFYGNWLVSAQALCNAADILEKAYQKSCGTRAKLENGDPLPPENMVQPIALMLYGFALENLLKGLYSKTQPIVTDQKFHRDLLIHDLCKLCEKTNFSVSTKEKKTLEHVAHVMTSVGRYPVSLGGKEYQMESKPIGGYGLKYSSWTPDDFEILKRLIERLRAKLLEQKS